MDEWWTGRRRWFLNAPLGACDALFPEAWAQFVLHLMDRLTIKRTSLSPGRIVFTASLDKVSIGLIEFTQITTEITQILIILVGAGVDSTDTADAPERYNILAGSVRRLRVHYSALQKQAQEEIGQIDPVSEASITLSAEELPAGARRKQMGRAPASYNEWARSQWSKSAKDREAYNMIYRGWLRQQEVSETPDTRPLLRDRFRKAINRSEGRK